MQRTEEKMLERGKADVLSQERKRKEGKWSRIESHERREKMVQACLEERGEIIRSVNLH